MAIVFYAAGKASHGDNVNAARVCLAPTSVGGENVRCPPFSKLPTTCRNLVIE